MKPQCNTSAECLRELARVMEQFGFDSIVDALQSKYCAWGGARITNPGAAIEAFAKAARLLTCAIAEVEGKPVFIGDELYGEEGLKFVAMQVHSVMFLQKLSWNPPEPETTTIELKLSTVKRFAKIVANEDGDAGTLDDIAQACKKALEQIK